MSNVKQRVINRLRRETPDRTHITQSEFERDLGEPGYRSEIASYQPERAISIVSGQAFDLSVVATETFTTDGTADNTETFTLGNDLIESRAVAEDLILYDAGQQVEPASIDYGADSFDYASPNTNSTLTVYYTAGEQAAISIQKESPSGSTESLWSDDVGMVHRRNQSKDPLTFSFQRPLQPVVPKNFRLKIYVDAPYTATLVGQDANGDGDIEPATNALTAVPIAGAAGEVEEAAEAVRFSMAER